VFSTRLLVASVLAVLAGTGVALAAASSQKAVDSSATVWFTNPNNFDSKVNSSEEFCLPNRRVELRKVRNNRPHKSFGIEKTANNGWADHVLGRDVERGRFYVKVAERQLVTGTCAQARSGTTTVGF
jgi:hypothetical protein